MTPVFFLDRSSVSQASNPAPSSSPPKIVPLIIRAHTIGRASLQLKLSFRHLQMDLGRASSSESYKALRPVISSCFGAFFIGSYLFIDAIVWTSV